MQHFYATHPEYKTINEQVEKKLAQRNRAVQLGSLRVQRTTAVVTLPVVVHIIHNNGAENISDAQVMQGIQHLNEAYANTGYYDPADGVNTQIQFCMAQRDPSNNATNGITRDVSPYTVMGGADYYSDDQNVKNIVRWNPLCYINIWLVKSIPGSVVGYAYLPSAHGSSVDGIIIEAGYFGSSYPNDVVVAHEMGHYLGLYHTFEGGCTNNDCTSDGDKVCDTPPDQSTAGISCTSSANSCTTDVLSGFATDQNDLTQDYMDYGNFNCMKVFTQGQADRMNWFIQNVRQSLLACKSCMMPCPAPVTAGFTAPAAPYYAGNSYTFTNTSSNAATYEWYVNGVLQSTSVNFNYTFPLVGSYTIKVIAKAGSILCSDDSKTVTVNVVCGAFASFSKSAAIVAAGTNINFSNTSTGATSYEWQVNGVTQSTATNFSYTSSTSGKYIIKLIAKNTAANCQQQYIDTVEYTCSVITSFTPANAAALINTPVTFTSTGSGETTYQWFVNGIAAGNSSSLTYTFAAVGAYSIQLVTGNGICNASANTVEYVNDKCGNAQYQFEKTFGAGVNSGARSIQQTPDGGSVLSVRYIAAGNTIYDAAILKTDEAGNLQWMKQYTKNAGSFFYKTKPSPDGGYIAIGSNTIPGNGGSRIFIVKTDATGNIVWSREYSIPGASGSEGTDIVASADGYYYFSGNASYVTTLTTNNDVVAGKIDASGNLVWLNNYDARSNESAGGMAEDKNQLILCGNIAGVNGTAGFLLKINKTDGTAAWSNTYTSADENWLGIMVAANGYTIDAIRRANSGSIYTDHVFLQTDFNGKITYSKFIQPFGTGKETGSAASVINNKGNLFSITSGVFGGTYYDFIVQEISFSSGILWTKKYNKPSSWITSLDKTASNGIYLGGFSIELSAPPLQTDIIKLDSAGNAGNCVSENVNTTLLPAQYNSGAADFIRKAIQPQIISNHTATVADVTVNTLCQYVKCDSVAHPVDTCAMCVDLHINGADTLSVCNPKDSLAVSIIRDFNCPLPLQWIIDSSFAHLTVIDSATIHLTFSRTGTTKLYAKVGNLSCGVVTDSATINVFSSPPVLNLGPDIQLCSFSTFKLNAGAGFKTYLWNDGSVDSTLTAYFPGQYFVTATDYCNNQYRDTINITLAPIVPFDLGPDLEKCNNDTLTLTAPGNFAAYSWAANYNINTINGATVSVWPSVDTTYTVVALVANGCTVIDTIRIKTKQAPVINIGNDTSLCKGANLVLQAPAGFSNYLWQDGSTGNSCTISKPGVYWLHATAANGCVAKDSLNIKDIYPLPVNFLDQEMNICDGKNLVLTAIGNWTAYHWFDNSTGSSVSISHAGQYWLQVTSAEGCTATDTIVITSKDCINSIYFPNAFTPDKNGNNDLYKPVVHGVPVTFRLDIYNRFGEKVFETTDFTKGWDGTYKNKLQPPDGFVWYCAYQFPGNSAKMEKGALILIR